MGVQDLDARFDAIETGEGTIARTAVEAIRAAAREVNDLVQGEPYQLVTFIQACETAGHQARTYLNFPPSEQPGRQEDPDPDPYTGLTVDDLKAMITKRNRERPDDSQLPVSGTKAELVTRLHADDAQRQS